MGVFLMVLVNLNVLSGDTTRWGFHSNLSLLVRRESADLVSPADGQEPGCLQPCSQQHGGRAAPPGQDPQGGEEPLRAGEQPQRPGVCVCVCVLFVFL